MVANLDGLSREIPVSSIHSYLFISYCTGISVSDVKEPSDIAVDWVSNHIYWVDTKAKTIEVADHDGLSRKIPVSSIHSYLFISYCTGISVSDVKEPSDIAVDWVSNHIYWVDTKAKTIEVADYDGLSWKIPVSSIHSYLFISYCTGISVSDVKEPSDIAVDWVSNHIYWVDTKAKTIEVADYDGLSRKILVSSIHSYLFISYCTGISVSDVKEPSDIAVDWVSNHIYWVDVKAKTIEVADYDGL